MKKNTFFLACTCIIIGFVYRLIPNHPPNVTPIAAIALVGGIYLKRTSLAFLVPFVALYFSDIILNNTVNRAFFADHTGLVLWDSYMFWTYGAFMLTVLIGLFLRKFGTGQKMILGALLSSVLFFVLTNIGSWLFIPMYTKDIGGLLACFTAAIPFFRNTLLGNLVFIIAFIGIIDLVQSRVVATRSIA